MDSSHNVNQAMARKFSLSPTRISTFLACPTKYFWTYLDSRGRYFIRSKSYFSFGTSLHTVLQRFHDSKDTGVESKEQAIAALEESWIDAGYSSSQEMLEALGDGKEVLEAYMDRVAVSGEVAKTLLIEKFLKFDLGDFILQGKLDRLDELEDGTLEVVDYKSGRSTVTPEDIQGDLAMSIYQYLTQKNYEDRPVRAKIIALRSGDEAFYAMTEAEHVQLEADVLQVGELIMSFTSRVTQEDASVDAPEYKLLCKSCDFLPLCQRHGLRVPPAEQPQSKV
jgi:RecB family exonuclease